MTSFTISLQVHHVARDLHFLTETFATQPAFCMTSGELVSGQPRRSSVWHGPLFQGATRSHFDQALEALLQFVKQHNATLAEFAGDDGLMEAIFTFHVAASSAKSGDLAHSVNLHPVLLYELSSRQIGVKVQTAYAADV
jgi:hypothetical protein